MNYSFKEFFFESSDGVNSIHGELYVPTEREIRGVVQISHGMIDYIGRYESLADFLVAEGYVVAGNDHLGHGGSVKCDEDFGFIASENGYSLIIEDLHKMNAILRERFPSVPIVMLGHSMGSFMARLYAVKYPESIDGLIIHGTGGKNPLSAIGIGLVKLLRRIYGERHRSKLVKSLAFGSYNNRFDKSEGEWAWLTRDGSRVATRDTERRTAFIFTLAGYLDLFTALDKSNAKEWYEQYPKSLPTLIMSGEEDPVGNYGKGIREVHEGLISAGVSSLRCKLYEGARHELFNETNCQEAFIDILSWLGEIE